MRSALAASAVLALAGSSYGFVVNQFAIVPGGSLSPDVGGFYNFASGAFVTGNLVTGSRATWKNYGHYIAGTTYLGADRAGGFADGFSLELTGFGTPNPIVPEWNAATGNQLGGGTRLSADTNPDAEIDGGGPGYTWGAGDTANFLAPSAVSNVNGRLVDSIFFGQFVFADPSATGLVGNDLLVQIDGVNNFLPLSGAKGTGGYAIEYESFVTANGNNGVRGFVVIPTPGAMGLLGVAGLAAIRRRR